MIITDPNELKYRHALQQDYLLTLESIMILVEDLTRKPRLSEQDFEFMTDKVRTFSNSYMELQSEYWKQTSAKSRENIVEIVSENIITQIPKFKSKPDLIESYILEAMPTLVESLHIYYLNILNEEYKKQNANNQ